MQRTALRTSQTRDGRKVAMWQLIGLTTRILRVQLIPESFTAHRLPSKTPLPAVQPGTILFDAYPDLTDARQMLPKHSDLWDALQHDYWAALLNPADIGRGTSGA
ncbi:hypothetical protein ACIBJI_35595 [Nocardia sp. NPDC050408]|uniref:hypothetical protein n=1 Tax=unclassified Nocardia TaxID=2637762 RepID=UPI003411F8FE